MDKSWPTVQASGSLSTREVLGQRTRCFSSFNDSGRHLLKRAGSKSILTGLQPHYYLTECVCVCVWLHRPAQFITHNVHYLAQTGGGGGVYYSRWMRAVKVQRRCRLRHGLFLQPHFVTFTMSTSGFHSKSRVLHGAGIRNSSRRVFISDSGPAGGTTRSSKPPGWSLFLKKKRSWVNFGALNRLIKHVMNGLKVTSVGTR